MSHPFGAIYHTYHGTMNAVCMPAVLQFSRPAIDGAIGQAAAYLGVSEEFDGSCAFVDDLIASLQIPPSLLGLGIEVPDIERIVSGALEDPSTGGNPVEITAENTREILLKIFCV